MGRFTVKEAIPNELIESEPQVVQVVADRMVYELCEALSKLLSDGQTYVVKMDKPEVYGNWDPDYNTTGYKASIRYEKYGWNLCSESLPCDAQKVMACTENGDMMIGMYTMFGWVFPCHMDKPIAWMPLPNPYKEK